MCLSTCSLPRLPLGWTTEYTTSENSKQCREQLTHEPEAVRNLYQRHHGWAQFGGHPRRWTQWGHEALGEGTRGTFLTHPRKAGWCPLASESRRNWTPWGTGKSQDHGWTVHPIKRVPWVDRRQHHPRVRMPGVSALVTAQSYSQSQSHNDEKGTAKRKLDSKKSDSPMNLRTGYLGTPLGKQKAPIGADTALQSSTSQQTWGGRNRKIQEARLKSREAGMLS